MKLNDKNIASFAVCSSPVDKEGYLLKKGEEKKELQRRWFVLKGNLLFYFQKKQDKEPLGVVVLEACSVQVSSHARYAFEIAFDGQGTRTYVLAADNDEEMQAWMKAISHASYEYLRSIVNELQRRVNLLTSSSQPSDGQSSGMALLHVGPSKMARTPQRALSEKLTSRGNESSSSGGGGGPGAPVTTKVKSGPRVTVRNGILVDIDDDEDAPPVPLKKKSQTVHSSSRRPPGGGGAKLLITVDDTDDINHPVQLPHASSTIHSRPIHYLPSQQPHSSPLVPAVPIRNSSALDRTPVLRPTSVSPAPTTSSSINEASHQGSSVYPPPRPTKPEPYQNGRASLLVLSDSSSSTSSVASIPGAAPSTRQTSAGPSDTKKSVFEMHQDFTQAMEALKSERTS
jgi:hypothetical protein